jgi:hypothetical protein
MSDDHDRKRRAAFDDFVRAYLVRSMGRPAAARAHAEAFSIGLPPPKAAPKPRRARRER